MGPSCDFCSHLTTAVSPTMSWRRWAAGKRRSGISRLISSDLSMHDVRAPPIHLPAGSRLKQTPTRRLQSLYTANQTSNIRESWELLIRWSKRHELEREGSLDTLDFTNKVCVLGGGSFATAMGAALARRKRELEVVMLLRREDVCAHINQQHENSRYLPGIPLPHNLTATTDAAVALRGAQYALHAVPVQASREFLKAVRHLLPEDVPLICVAKGIEQTTGNLLSELIPSALGRDQPTVFLSGPSFAKEVAENKLTCLTAASESLELSQRVQGLFAQNSIRINLSTDVRGVEVCGALKNVLAIAAGIVEGQGLGSNALAAVISQGCAEIRWLACEMGGRQETVAGLSGFADIMLTCYGALSRNRRVGVCLGKGESIQDVLASSTQVAEGVATAGSVVYLARKYRVSLPVLTAVAAVLAGDCNVEEAVKAVVGLPQVEER